MPNAEQKVLSKIDQDSTVQMLQEIVRLSAWEDYSRPDSDWEWKRAEYIRNKMVEIGFDLVPTSEVGEVSYRRPTLIGFLRGTDSGQPALFWTAHIDTACPPEAFPRPYESWVENGEVRGVGTCDQVGAIAAGLAAFEAIKKANAQLKRSLMVIFTSDEMEGARGAELAHRWMKKHKVIPDFGLCAEPTGNNLGLAHTGINEFEIEITGLTGHPSFKTKGVGLPIHSPVARMADVIKTLLEIENKEEAFKRAHPLVGPSYTWLGPIEGGTRPHGICWAGSPSDPLLDGMTSHEAFGHHIRCAHMQPEYCKILFGVRTIPRKIKPGEMFHTKPEKGTSNKEILEMIDRNLKELWQKSPSSTSYTIKRTSDRSIPFEISPVEPHIKALVKVVEGVTGKTPKFLGTKHWTEVGRLAEELGTPFVQIAPTWLRYHRADEGIPITDLMESARIYAAAILRFCNSPV